MEVYTAVLTEGGNITEIVGVFADLNLSFTALKERMEETWELWNEDVSQYPQFHENGLSVTLSDSNIGGYVQTWSI